MKTNVLNYENNLLSSEPWWRTLEIKGKNCETSYLIKRETEKEELISVTSYFE